MVERPGSTSSPNEQSGAQPHFDPRGSLDALREPLEQALQRILWELRPYLPEVVVIGGWVPYLHQRYGSFPGWRVRLSLTAEVDILVQSRLDPRDRPPIADVLHAAGFQPIGAGPAAAVWESDPSGGEKIEFLVPHTGTYRSLGTVVPVRAQPGVGAIALGRLEVMQERTTTLRIPAMSVDGRSDLVTVRIPELGAYVLNKAATFQQRRPLAGSWPSCARRGPPCAARSALIVGSVASRSWRGARDRTWTTSSASPRMRGSRR